MQAMLGMKRQTLSESMSHCATGSTECKLESSWEFSAVALDTSDELTDIVNRILR